MRPNDAEGMANSIDSNETANEQLNNLGTALFAHHVYPNT